jgi:hypothetical protein
MENIHYPHSPNVAPFPLSPAPPLHGRGTSQRKALAHQKHETTRASACRYQPLRTARPRTLNDRELAPLPKTSWRMWLDWYVLRLLDVGSSENVRWGELARPEGDGLARNKAGADPILSLHR